MNEQKIEHREKRSSLRYLFSFFQVDLAGSENIGRSGAVDKRAREAGMYYWDFYSNIFIIYCVLLLTICALPLFLYKDLIFSPLCQMFTNHTNNVIKYDDHHPMEKACFFFHSFGFNRE